MQKRFNTLLAPENRGGNLRPVSGASVTVTDPNGALATIYSDNGVTEADNPLTTGATGEYEYYAADGRYTETIVKAGRDTVTISDILLEDPADSPSPTSAALAASGGSALVGTVQSGTGAVARTAQDKLRETVSVKDFGAVGDGAADDTAAINAASAAAAASGGAVVFPNGRYNFTFTKPPYHVTWRFEGTDITRDKLGGASSAVRFLRPMLTYLDGPHATDQVQVEHNRVIAKGSGAIGAQYADYAHGITIEKENWSEASGVPVAGEINGLTMFLRNGCVTGDPVKTGGAAILANIGQTAGSGYVQFLESLNSVYAKGSLAVSKQTNMQLQGIDEHTGISYGAVFNSVVGNQSAVLRIVGTAASAWTRILENIKDGITNFVITDEGQIRWRKTATVTLDQEASTNDLLFKTEAGVEMARLDQSQSLFQAKTRTNVKTGATYTLTLDDLDTVVSMTHSAAITLTVPNSLPAGFKCRVLQRDAAAQVTLTPEAGALLRNVDGHTKTKGQHAIVDLVITGNTTGTAAIYYMSGSTAA
jgi:hypothetical protein